MRVGSIVYATEQGLGYLAKAFFDAGVVTDVMVVAHGSRRNLHQQWYPGAQLITGLWDTHQQEAMRAFCGAVDAMLFFETPFHWPLVDHCRSAGVTTFLMPMYECMPERLPAVPDVFLCPSLLDLDYYSDSARPPAFVPTGSKFRPAVCYHTPVPTPSPQEVPWRKRTRAEVFVHNAGHGGLKGRNGTAEFVNAVERHMKSTAKVIIRTQGGFTTGDYPIVDPRVSFRTGTFDRHALYDEGDVFVFPEKFNGLSLPLQEAAAAGMLVMTTDRYPNNAYLPNEPLIPVRGYRRSRVSGRCNEFDEAVIDPRDVAETIDYWYGRDVTAYSEAGRAWAELNGWDRLGPKYREVIEECVRKR